MADAADTAKKQREDVLRENAFKPGQSGNPAGRAKGSRTKLAEHFVADLQAAWKDHGMEVIAAVIKDKPGDFLKVVASVLPKEIKIDRSPIDELDDEQLAAYLALARAAYDAHSSAGAGTEQAGGGEPPSSVQTLQ